MAIKVAKSVFHSKKKKKRERAKKERREEKEQKEKCNRIQAGDGLQEIIHPGSTGLHNLDVSGYFSLLYGSIPVEEG